MNRKPGTRYRQRDGLKRIVTSLLTMSERAAQGSFASLPVRFFLLLVLGYAQWRVLPFVSDMAGLPDDAFDDFPPLYSGDSAAGLMALSQCLLALAVIMQQVLASGCWRPQRSHPSKWRGLDEIESIRNGPGRLRALFGSYAAAPRAPDTS